MYRNKFTDKRCRKYLLYRRTPHEDIDKLCNLDCNHFYNRNYQCENFHDIIQKSSIHPFTADLLSFLNRLHGIIEFTFLSINFSTRLPMDSLINFVQLHPRHLNLMKYTIETLIQSILIIYLTFLFLPFQPVFERLQ